VGIFFSFLFYSIRLKSVSKIHLGERERGSGAYQIRQATTHRDKTGGVDKKRQIKGISKVETKQKQNKNNKTNKIM
jgi:hypothetical protein